MFHPTLRSASTLLFCTFLFVFAAAIYLPTRCEAAADYTVNPNFQEVPGTDALDPLAWLQGALFYMMAGAVLIGLCAMLWWLARAYFEADRADLQREKREYLTAFVVGLLILGFGGVIAAQIIDPDLAALSLPTFSRLNKANDLPLPPAITEDDKAIQAILSQYGGSLPAGISGIHSSAEAQAWLQMVNGLLKADGSGTISIGGVGTSITGVRQGTLQEALNMALACGCNVTITSGTDNHPNDRGTYTHTNGYKMDFAPSSQLDRYVQQNFKPAGIRPSDNAAMYVDPKTGAIWARESDHWDVVVGKP